MKKRFVAAINSPTPEADERFRQWLGSRGWWHWLANTWLITDLNGSLTAIDIRDKINELYPGSYSMVIELRDDGTDSWAGFGPKSAEKNMFTWFSDNWTKK